MFILYRTLKKMNCDFSTPINSTKQPFRAKCRECVVVEVLVHLIAYCIAKKAVENK